MQYRTHRNAGRTVAVATVLLCGVALVPPLAGAAGLGGKSTGNESVTSATWGVTASVTTMTFTTNTYQTSTVTNNGTVALVAESYSVTVSNPSSGSPTFKVFQCAVGMVGEQVRRRGRHPGRRHPGQELDHHHHQHDGDGRRRPSLPPGGADRRDRVDGGDDLDQDRRAFPTPGGGQDEPVIGGSEPRPG